MLHPFAILVSSKGEQHEVTVPFVDPRRFHGRSESTLYDDVALALMERVVSTSQEYLPAFLYCPETIHRRVKAEVSFPERVRWQGPLSVVLRRWPGEDFFEATIPRLGMDRFVVDRPSSLEAAVARWLLESVGQDVPSFIARLDGAKCRSHEHLDWIEVDLELPTILPRSARKRTKPQQSERDETATVERAKRRREVPPATLRQIGTNLVHRVLDGRVARIVGRDAMIDALARRLKRPGGVLLVGPSGAGKTAIVEAAIAKLTGEEARLHARMDAWRIDANRLIAGMSFVGQWEARCEAMVGELSARGDLLVVDDLPSLVWAGRTRHEETNVAGFLAPHLAQGELRIVGECTPERLEAARDLAPSFFASFHPIWVPPLDEATSQRALLSRVRQIERTGMWAGAPMRIDPAVPPAVLALTRRFAASQPLPGRAVRLLEQLATEAPSTKLDEDERRVLDREALVALFAAQTGLPRFVLWEEDGRPHAEVLAHFERRIVEQRAAAEAVAEVITTLQQGLNDPVKPIASMLLVGPTGVGKTETAKAIAEYLFGSADRLVRFDMSEMQDPYSATRLFGDALRPDGELTRRVRQRPFAVILLDEIEKAHPAVFDVLLALLGEGRLTSADGRTTDFCNTVVLMTSNLGVREADGSIGFSEVEPPDRGAHYVSAVRAFFRPELFNRIDRIVPFRALGRAAIRPLAERAVLELMSRRGLRRAGVLVDVDDALLEVIAHKGFDARYGARALHRVVEQELAVPLARRLVSSPAETITLVSLFREGQGVGLDVWPLEAPRHAHLQKAGLLARVGSWDALRARFAEILSWLAREAGSIERARDACSRLLSRFSQGTLAEDEWPRFTMLQELTERFTDLQRRLARFEDEIVEPERFAERRAVKRRVDDWTLVSEEHLVQDVQTVDPSSRPSPQVIAELRHLAFEAAEVLYRARIADDPVEHLIVRVLAATRDPESLELVTRVGGSLVAAGGPWGDVAVFAIDGGWAAPEDAFGRPRAGIAVSLSAIRAREHVEPELGLHLSTRYGGPDRIAGLVRVEIVMAVASRPSAAEVIARLEASDAEHAAFVEARRRGENVTSPRGPLPLRRHFEQGVATDLETGIVLRLDDLGRGARDCQRIRIACSLWEPG